MRELSSPPGAVHFFIVCRSGVPPDPTSEDVGRDGQPTRRLPQECGLGTRRPTTTSAIDQQEL